MATKFVEFSFDSSVLIDRLEDVINQFRSEEKAMEAYDFSLSSSGDDVYIQWQRPETEEEEKARLKKLSELEQRQLEYERRKYQELKKKFESESK